MQSVECDVLDLLCRIQPPFWIVVNQLTNSQAALSAIQDLMGINDLRHLRCGEFEVDDRSAHT